MVALAHRMENCIHDEVAANGTSIGRLLEPTVQVILFTVYLAQHIVERLAWNQQIIITKSNHITTEDEPLKGRPQEQHVKHPVWNRFPIA